MKQLLLSALLLALPTLTFAQSVGIGITTPDASAVLDLTSSSKGALLPRVSSTTAITSPATGLIVYQTGGTAGYYYYDGTVWQQVVPASSTGFIRSQTNQQAGASFNVDGSGTVGTLMVGGAITGNGASISGVGVGVRADGGLNLGQNLGQNNSGNIYLGYQAGRVNTGSYNLFSGYQSGYSTTSGGYNLFIGHQSGYSNTAGTGNLFAGVWSGLSNTTGSYNVFSGYQSGYSNTSGGANQFVGYQSGYFSTTASNNTFSGYNSGYSNTVGGSNLFNGCISGYNNTTGNNNAFSGYQSGYNNTSGSGNTALGYQSGPTNGNGSISNAMALGNGATVNASNTIQLGNSSITTLYCKVNLTATSDARFKYDVQANVPGLAFITRLRPVTYRFDDERLSAFERTGTLPARSAPDPAAAVHSGFLAQEVEATAHSLGFRFDGVHAPANARDHYGLGYAQFVVPLVRAVQELSAENEALKARAAVLEARAAQAEADHADLQTLKAQLAHLLGEGPQAQK